MELKEYRKKYIIGGKLLYFIIFSSRQISFFTFMELSFSLYMSKTTITILTKGSGGVCACQLWKFFLDDSSSPHPPLTITRLIQRLSKVGIQASKYLCCISFEWKSKTETKLS